GGAKVTFWTFIVMIAGVLGVMYFLANKDASFGFYGFFASFMLLFLATGVGNASTFQMIPAIFREEVARLMPHLSPAEQLPHAERESAATIGFTSAIAAYGAFFIPKAFGTSIDMTGGVGAALIGFIVFYAASMVLTWFYYSRKGAEIRSEATPHAAPAAYSSIKAAHSQVHRPCRLRLGGQIRSEATMSHFLDSLRYRTTGPSQFAEGHGGCRDESRE